ncbi:hypothetical protein [Cupriavidus sp. H39]|uniref:hypothetical protein n=1 Tax=Cupriavidus sp. H39 TaxID=3401635 RepID=UPI003D06914C
MSDPLVASKWSYDEVTAVAEKTIRLLLEEGDDVLALLPRNEWVAYGVYLELISK